MSKRVEKDAKLKVKKLKLNGQLRDSIKISEYAVMQYEAIKYLFKYAPVRTAMLVILLVTVSFQEYISLRYIEYVTDAVSRLYTDASRAVFVDAMGSVAVFLAMLLLMLLANFAVRYVKIKYTEYIKYTIQKNITLKLGSISYENFESNKFYEQLEMIKKVPNRFPDAIEGFIHIIKTLCMTVIYWILLSEINIFFSIAVTLITVVFIFTSVKLIQSQNEFYKTKVMPSSRRRGYFQYIYSSRPAQCTIQTNRLYRYFANHYEYWNKKNALFYLKYDVYNVSMNSLQLVLRVAVSFVMLWIVASNCTAGALPLGTFAMLITLLANYFSNISQYSSFISSSSFFARLLSMFFELMETDDKYDYGAKSESVAGNGTVVLKNITYKYPQTDNLVVKNINLNIGAGEKISLVGENGCGKTTVIGIITGLLDSYSGNIYIDGTDVEHRYSDNISVLSQDFGEYQLSIKENIEIGCKCEVLSDTDAWSILKEVGLEEFVRSLPEGVNTKLGQLSGGIELSKGQWQRLAIARLLANKKANIWILDEPTAHLDPEAEIDVYNLVLNHAGERTVIFVSHRLGFAKSSDRIFVMNKGEIFEQGTHKELMALHGKYHDMFEIQKSWYV